MNRAASRFASRKPVTPLSGCRSTTQQHIHANHIQNYFQAA
ncbi:hypothetical protein [Kingella oralis]|uniref:Uncharacterized protein n=1 Tax=Kingella oralis ATCC 51147 TaxID=629741 RepID=C4GK91_9NEIS|nr:hypothetical protein [Kingella oralis]EEP68213.1 hypothetical protein GCWU000324_02465 [Kingella oralis ATCC 51147]